jgi:hypothetical protein
VTVHFPKGARCDDAYHAMWPALEKQMLPFIKAKARRIRSFAGGLDMDDAIQEGRLALLSVIIKGKYDYTKGELSSYVGKVLDNTYRSMLYQMLNQTRMPRAVVRGDDGEWLELPSPPMSLNGLEGDPGGWAGDDVGNHSLLSKALTDMEMPTPEGATQYKELEAQARIFKLKLLNSLKGRDKKVFECRTNPPVDFLKMVENIGGDIYNPTIPQIAEYLGINKNAVDYSVSKIKTIFTRMARQDEFIDLFGERLETKEWPMVRMSRAAEHDREFVRRIIQQRELDPKPVEGYESKPDFYQTAGMYSRLIERYPWGVVLVVRRKGTWRTMVIECTAFNPSTGALAGERGTKESVPVRWYPQLVNALAEGTGI